LKIYHGINEDPAHGGFVVKVEENGKFKTLDPSPSQKLYNHSPTGFSWGYHGSGPSQLALALLLDATGDKDVALKYYQSFKYRTVAQWDGDSSWDYTEEQIKAWLSTIMNKNDE
jgi:hypothetical protein